MEPQETANQSSSDAAVPVPVEAALPAEAAAESPETLREALSAKTQEA